jgi:hypothetical protein
VAYKGESELPLLSSQRLASLEIQKPTIIKDKSSGDSKKEEERMRSDINQDRFLPTVTVKNPHGEQNRPSHTLGENSKSLLS